MELTPDHMQKLVELLRPPEPEVLQGDELVSSEFQITSTRSKGEQQQNNVKETPKTIEEYEEQEAKEADELGRIGFRLEDRKTPEYSMLYQQAVTPEDVFLQMGPKTPSSSSCEHLVVKIKMPGDKRENVDLTVNTTSIIIVSPQHYLNLPLPHGVDPDGSKANWDGSESTLILTLKLDREFDFANF